MVVTRANIVTDAPAREKYVRGVKLLKQHLTGRTTADLGISGPTRPMSTYDTFVLWHFRAMMRMTPNPNSVGRNAAHVGPVFLPWHRLMLRVFEKALQEVLADPTFGLPYWDWAADGEKTVAQQRAAAIWNSDCMGGQSVSGAVTGPFAFDPNNAASWRIVIESLTGPLISPQNDRGLIRRRGQDPVSRSLPKKSHVRTALDETFYDAAPFARDSTGFRNRLEGWRPSRGLHNLVHIWIGGDMDPATSPNDPVFFLNHCNVDRIWEAWMVKRREAGQALTYLPDQSADPELTFHRIDDKMYWIAAETRTPRQMLDIGSEYVYDTLAP